VTNPGKLRVLSRRTLANQRLRKKSFPLIYNVLEKRVTISRELPADAIASQTPHGPISRAVVKHEVDSYIVYAGVSYGERKRRWWPWRFCAPSGCSCFWIGGNRPPASSSRLARFYTRPHLRRKTGRRRSPAFARSLAKVYRKTTGRIASPGPVNERTRSRRSKVRVEEEIRL